MLKIYGASGRREHEKHIVEFNSPTPNFSLVGGKHVCEHFLSSPKYCSIIIPGYPLHQIFLPLEVLLLSIQKNKPPFLVLSPADLSFSPTLNCLRFHTVLSLFVLSVWSWALLSILAFIYQVWLPGKLSHASTVLLASPLEAFHPCNYYPLFC